MFGGGGKAGGVGRVTPNVCVSDPNPPYNTHHLPLLSQSAALFDSEFAMFSKFSTFRSRGSTSQKGKHNHYGRFDSQLHTDEGPTSSKSNVSYFSSSSFSIDKSTSEVTSVQPVLSHSTPSSVATGNSSPGSFQGNSTYDSKESQTTLSALSEEIDIGLHVLLPYEDAEEQFLQEHEDYFLHLSVDNIRKDQYPMLELQRIVYFDYSTCPLFPQYQVERHMQFLLEETNPYLVSNAISGKPTGQSNSYINSTYERILNVLNTTQNHYSIVFTNGLSSCYRMFGEMHHFQKGSVLLVDHDNHKSVQHMLQAAAQCSVKTGVVPLTKKDLCTYDNDMHIVLRKQGWSGRGCGLLVYPVQSSKSGVRHSLSWTVDAQQNGWKVLLDVSGCLPMVRVDLSLYQPEFLIGSLHHMLGYPSGVGFLLIRRSSHSICTQKGSNQLKIAELPESGKAVHVTTEGESLSIHTFAAFTFGLEHLERMGITAIQKRIESLYAWLVKTLKSLSHKLDEKPLLKLYGSLGQKYRGSILTLNVLDPTGNIYPPGLVQRLAERSNIFLGASSLSGSDLSYLLHHKSDKQVNTLSRYASTSHLPVVRVSLGPVSTFGDAYRLVQFLSRFRDEDYMSSEAAGYVEELEGVC